MVLVDTLIAPASALTYLKRAAFIAQASEHGIYKMGAVAVRHGNVVAIGWNKNRTHPRAKNFTRKIHAELAAIIGHNVDASDMYVVRITKGGKMATSKPCRDCEVLLKEAGLKSVTYISEGGLVCSTKF